MRKIALLCSSGLSTSMLVKKMREAAEKDGYEIEIGAYAIGQAETTCVGADVILIAPQAAWKKDSVKKLFPDCPQEVIEMQTYGMVDGAKVIKRVKELLGD